MSFNIRLLLLPAIVVINACNNHSATRDKSQIGFEHGYDRNTYQVLDYNWPSRS